MLLMLLENFFMFIGRQMLASVTGNLDPAKQAQWLDEHGWKYQFADDGTVFVYTLEWSRKSQQQRERLLAEKRDRAGDLIRTPIFRTGRRPTGFVYLICAEHLDKPTKVGHTTGVNDRLKALQSGSPLRLRVVMHYGAEDVDLAKQIERAIHAHYKQRRMHGEWFDVPATEIIDWINAEFAARLSLEGA